MKRVIRGDKAAGDLGLGQTGFNPFGFEYTEEQYFEKQTQEIKHGRLAMIGALGMLLQVSLDFRRVIEGGNHSILVVSCGPCIRQLW